MDINLVICMLFLEVEIVKLVIVYLGVFLLVVKYIIVMWGRIKGFCFGLVNIECELLL